MGALLFIKF